MHNRFRRSPMIGAALCLSLIASTAVSQAPRKTGKRWLDMNYGPYLTASIESSLPERNIAQKGVAIKLGGSDYVTFDTDLMRYSCGWTGDFLNFRGVAFDGSHGTWPSVAGKQIFGTRLRAGWAKDGKFEDPRTKYEGTGYGPLPHEWAKYRGLYLHGERVILSYRVGETDVLDSPGRRKSGDVSVFTRTINVGKSSTSLLINVLEHDGELSVLSVKNLTSLKPAVPIEGALIVTGDAAKLLDGTKQADGKASPSTKGLVAHWTFDETKAEKAASTKSEHVAELTGAKWDKGRDGGCATFAKGAHAVVADSKAFDLSRDFSITAWVRTTKGGTIFSKTTAGEWAHYGKTLFVRRGRVGFDVGWVGVVESHQKVNDGRWHHVALTYRDRDGQARLYVDGELGGERPLKSMPDPMGSRVRFGYTSTNFPDGGKSLLGSLDEIRFYNRVLSAAELGVKPSASLVAVGAVSDAKGLQWRTTESGQILLHVPADACPAKIGISIAHGDGATKEQLALLRDGVSQAGAPIDLSKLTKGGPKRWTETLTTKGARGKDDGPYVIDRITAPDDNPWGSWMRFGGFDFFKDGKRAAICTWSGDVWLVDGVDTLDTLTWRRIATGMYQPLGLKIVANDAGEEEIYVSCRDQITRLHDLNGDGEIDFYECFNHDHQVTEHFHEFAMDLQTDKDGNFYYAKSARHAKTPVVPHHGTLIKVSRDGTKSKIVCSGFRAANGVGIGPNGELMTSDQEGHWTPANRINLVKQDGFYGNLWAFEGTKRKESDGFDPPLCWLPKNVDRSPAEQLWVTSKKWGPLEGAMLHLSYGTGQVFLVMHETVNGQPQGAVVPIPGLRFPTGVMRGRFHPDNGQLYLCGLVGWSSNCATPGGFYRVRHTGKATHVPTALRVRPTGIQLTFTEPLSKPLAESVDSYAVEQWNYRWSKQYGSKHYSVANPRRTGQDEVDVVKATLSKDGKSVFLEIEDLQPVMQMRIALDLKAADGTPIRHVIHGTINQVPEK